MLSSNLKDIIASAASLASGVRSSSTDLVFVLIALLDDSQVQRALKDDGINYQTLRDKLLEEVDRRPVANSRPERMELSQLVQDVLESALTKNLQAGPAELLAEIWLLDRADEDDFSAVLTLLRAGSEANEAVVDRQVELMGASAIASDYDDIRVHQFHRPKTSLPEALTNYCVDLIEHASKGLIDPVFGRDEEIARLGEILGRRKKNNPILLGEPGVGKTAAVEGLAMLISQGKGPRNLTGVTILALDVGRMVAGTRSRGDFEERITALVEALEKSPGVILFVDEIHTLVGGLSGATDSANLLKPALQSGKMRCIGATTHGEYAKYFDADPAMSRRFQPINMVEPDRDKAIDIIRNVIPAYENHHSVVFDAGCAETAVDLTTRFIFGKQLPDKAIDVIDEAGAVAASKGKSTVSKADIEFIVSRMCGFELDTRGGEKMLSSLASVIRGQQIACESIARAVSRANAGLTRNGRAKLSLVFAGPDSCGKRHAAEALAKLQGSPVYRMNMSEFREAHSLSRLIGSPPGYVGYGTGQMTEAVRRQPSGLLLLERIDLAHPNIMEIIQQAVETGQVTDAAGRTISFAGTTIVMTALAEREHAGIGFRSMKASSMSGIPVDGNLLDAADAVIRFSALEEEALKEIAASLVEEFVTRLRSRDIVATTFGDIAALVATEARTDGASGRAVGRAFKALVENAVLDASPAIGSTVRVDADEEGRHISVAVGTSAA